MRTLAIISARGGSKRIPGKNILDVRGKPLIAWTIQAGLLARSIDRLILSTDDVSIAEVAASYGCEVPFIRPAHLATDSASSIDVISHALEQAPGYTHVVLLQPTSPLRKSTHIDEAFDLMNRKSASSCISARRARENPYWMQVVRPDGFIKKLINPAPSVTAPELPDILIPNGAIYIASISKFKEYGGFYTDKTIPYLMKESESVDIDTFEDLSSPHLKELDNKDLS